MGLIFGCPADFNSESFFNNHISNACLSQIPLPYWKCDKSIKMLAKLPNTNKIFYNCLLVVVVQMLSPVRFFATPWTAAHQASLSFTISRVCSNSCPLNQWCYLTISSSASPLSFCLQPFPSLGSYPMSWLFTSDGQSIGASGSSSVLPINIQGLFPLGLTGLIFFQPKELSKSLLKHHSSLWSNSHIHTWLLEKLLLWLDWLCWQSDVSAF